MPIIQPKSVTIDGVTYDSYAQAERELGLPKGSMSKRMAKEKALADTPVEATTDVPVEVSVEVPDEAANPVYTGDAGDADPGQSDKQAESPDHSPDAEQAKPERALVYAGVEYHTRREMAAALDLEYLKLNAYLRKYDTIDEAVEKCMSGETSLSISYGDTTYRSFKSLCDAHNIAPALVRQLATASGTDKMDAFEDLVTLREEAGIREDITLTSVPFCVVQGVPYRGMKELAAAHSIDAAILAYCTETSELDDALRMLQNQQTTVYALNGDENPVPLSHIMDAIERGELEHFDISQQSVPMYPKLQGIDIDEECYAVEPIREDIGTGQYARDRQDDAKIEQSMVMGGM